MEAQAQSLRSPESEVVLRVHQRAAELELFSPLPPEPRPQRRRCRFGAQRGAPRPLARVTGLLRGPDGRPLAAVIAPRGQTMRRPLSRLFALDAAEAA